MKFKKLFEPINIGKIQIKNRIAMAPMATLGLASPEGAITQRGIDYYAERARGGVGLLITGGTKVEEKIEPRFLTPLTAPASLPSFGELAETVHFYGSRIFVQLTPGLGRVAYGKLLDTGFKPISASATPAWWRPKISARELTTDEVETLVRACGIGGAILKTAGIDGVELHGHEGYLLDQFTTALWNKRTDKYGGNLESRLRFPIEILTAIKEAAGADFPVIYRYGLKHYLKKPQTNALPGEEFEEAGRDIEEGLEMARLLEKAGFDALHVDAGGYWAYWTHPPSYQAHGCMVDMAKEAKKVVKIPVITVGKLGSPELAEAVVKEGKADIVALGRQLLADPYWPRKLCEGRLEDIRPCINCFDGCLSRMTVEVKPLSCAVNPSTGREMAYTLRGSGKPKRVLVVGGGISGMEAARVAAIEGDSVKLYEKRDKLGGHLIPASIPDFKQDLKKLREMEETQLKKLAVEVVLNTTVDSGLIKKEKPHKVIIATGSVPIIPPIPGIENTNVSTCIDLLLGKKDPGDVVSVVGGGLVGCEVALWLADQGKKVTIVELLPEIGTGLFNAARVMLLDLFAAKKVSIITNAYVDEITNEAVNITLNNFEKRSIPCDTIALACGLEPRKDLYESLNGEIGELYAIGDCKEPRKIINAIWEAYNVARH